MDDFSDDDFDNLNDDVLQELENNAIQATQAHNPGQTQTGPAARHESFDQEFEDDDLDDTIVIDQLAQPPQPPPGLQRQQQQALPIGQPRHGTSLAGTHRWNQHLPQHHVATSNTPYPPRPAFQPPRPFAQPPVRQPIPSQRYPPVAPSQRYGPAASSQRYHQPARTTAVPPPGPRPSQFGGPSAVPISRPYTAQSSQSRHDPGPANQNDVIVALQARLSELESDLTAARGEASILRSKYDKAIAAHEAEVSRLKKENAEQVAKQERLAEQARIAERNLATELQFARQDLREELGRSKAKRKEGKDGPSTPRKTRTWGMPDGFDGVEILASPSKGQALRRKDAGPTMPAPSERTPTRKRKRPVVDSPTLALETDGDVALANNDQQTGASGSPRPAAIPGIQLDFLRLLLDHAAVHGQPPTFEVFSRYAFPSDPKHSLASMLLKRLPQMGHPGDPQSLLVEFADMVIELWHRCLVEKYHGPIYHLVALIAYTLQLNAVDVAPHIIPSFIPVCVTTCKLVALPRLKTQDGDLTAHPDPGVRQLCLHIDVAQCLAVLHLTALGCMPAPAQDKEPVDSPQPSPQGDYWRSLELDFILMMLAPSTPEAEWLTMMSMLRTSVMPDSIGPIPLPAAESGGRRTEATTREGVAAVLIDCVTSYLCEPPQWATTGTLKHVVARAAALATLAAFVTSPFGALQIAESSEAIPRLVAGLCWAIDQLYDSDLPVESSRANGPTADQAPAGSDPMDVDTPGMAAGTGADASSGQQLQQVGALGDGLAEQAHPMFFLCRIISQATSLLHFLVTDPRTSEVANISTKLAAAHGGSQRYFLTLARLNFAEEDLVLEAGIDADTVERAHELLELAVTPDEGEEIGEMFD
ncbi:hypothetical protein VTJ83DRAFT_5236 [Remersonia thermophila]|uniref:DNA repair protein Rad26 n=1 Tax=Remersonia thermophila TaxID=72144 RepID=A0ABR4DEF6_9PEZI